MSCVSGPSYQEEVDAPQRIANLNDFAKWPLIVLCDNARESTKNPSSFLWSTFTRFEPASDIYSKDTSLHRFHPILSTPVVIDTRLKPSYPDELFCDDVTERLVNNRWKEYFPKGFNL
jgi:4-hydroxybenzoate decarboxylase subunit C